MKPGSIIMGTIRHNRHDYNYDTTLVYIELDNDGTISALECEDTEVRTIGGMPVRLTPKKEAKIMEDIQRRVLEELPEPDVDNYFVEAFLEDR